MIRGQDIIGDACSASMKTANTHAGDIGKSKTCRSQANASSDSHLFSFLVSSLSAFTNPEVELQIPQASFGTFTPSLMFSYSFPRPQDGQLIFFLHKEEDKGNDHVFNSVMVDVCRRYSSANTSIRFCDDHGYCNYSSTPRSVANLFDCLADKETQSGKLSINCFASIQTCYKSGFAGVSSRPTGGCLMTRQLQRLIHKWEYTHLSVVWQETTKSSVSAITTRTSTLDARSSEASADLCERTAPISDQSEHSCF